MWALKEGRKLLRDFVLGNRLATFENEIARMEKAERSLLADRLMNGEEVDMGVAEQLIKDKLNNHSDKISRRIMKENEAFDKRVNDVTAGAIVGGGVGLVTGTTVGAGVGLIANKKDKK